MNGLGSEAPGLEGAAVRSRARCAAAVLAVVLGLALPSGGMGVSRTAHAKPQPGRAPPADHFAQLAAGQSQVCGVLTDASLTCWGGTNELPPTGRFRSVSVGNAPCALRLNGTVRCFGGGAADWSPSGHFRALGEGTLLRCGVRLDGSVLCWAYSASETWAHPGRFTSVSGGTAIGDRDAACALTIPRRLDCWGLYRRGAPAGQFRQVSVGAGNEAPPGVEPFIHFACAVRTSGKLACWGSGYKGLDKPPSGTFTDISAGGTFACAVRKGGAIVCWGNDYSGQLDAPKGRFIAVSAGQYDTCGLRPDRTAVCWGDDTDGETMVPSARFGQVALSVPQGSDGFGPYCGLRVDGSLVCWGMAPVPVFSGRFRQISMDPFGWFCALRASGAIDCGGYPGEPQLPTPPPGRFTQIGAAVAVVCGVRRTTDAIVCSSDSFGSQPFRPPGGRFRAVAVGDGGSYVFGCGLRVTGTVACWGDPTGEGGGPDGQTKPPAGKFAQITAGPYTACGIKVGGAVVCWGEAAGFSMPGRFTQISAEGVLCGVRVGGEVYCAGQAPAEGWSHGRYKQAAASYDPDTATVDLCAVRIDGAIVCWGDDGVVLPAAQS